MKTLNRAIFLLAFAAALRLDAPAYAYIDPGTGSMLLQLLLGGVAGGIVVLKLYWSRFKAIFVRSTVSDDHRRIPADSAD